MLTIDFSLQSLPDRELRILPTLVRIGQAALARRLESEGLSEQEIRDVFARLLPSIETFADLRVDAAAFTDLLAAVNAAMDTLRDDPAFQEIVDQGADDEEGVKAEAMAGAGNGRSIAAMTFAVILLIVAKSGVHYNFSTGEGWYDLAPGVPAGVSDIVSSVSGILTKEISGVLGATREPDERHERSESHSPSGSSQQHKTSGETKGGLPVPATHKGLVLPKVGGFHVSLQDAVRTKDELISFFDRQDILPWCGLSDPSRVFGPSQGFRDGDWPYDKPVVVGVGIIPEHRDDTDQTRYRIALRLQSQYEIKVAVQKKIANHFDSLSRHLVSVRWTSRVQSLGWAGSAALRSGPASGAEINVAGGPSGAVTLLVRKNNFVHLLTAGHVVKTGHSVHVGERVYSPILDRSSGTLVAKVVEGSLFPAYVPGLRHGAAAFDYALAKIENGQLPTQTHMEEFVGNKISLPAATTPQRWDPGEPPRVIKGPARTPFCAGQIEAIDVDVIIMDAAAGTEYSARNLVEVSLDGNRAVQSGDSGALITLRTGSGQAPLAMIVAGALNSRLRGFNSIMTSTVYALPLTSIPGIENMETP